jgi:hypothetical protein
MKKFIYAGLIACTIGSLFIGCGKDTGGNGNTGGGGNNTDKVIDGGNLISDGSLKWELTESGVLTILGAGDMPDYDGIDKFPPWWDKYLSKIKSIVITDGVTRIGDRAFQQCALVNTVSIGKEVKVIGDLAFWNCPSLESITIPDKVTDIGRKAFENCTFLKNATIGSAVTYIGDYAFLHCTNLTSVTIHAATPPPFFGFDNFKDNTDDVLYVPAGKKPAYEAVFLWKNAFKTIAEQP